MERDELSLKQTSCQPSSTQNRFETRDEMVPKRTCDRRMRSATPSNQPQGSTTGTNGQTNRQDLFAHLTSTSTTEEIPKVLCSLLPDTLSPRSTHRSESQRPGRLHPTQDRCRHPVDPEKSPTSKMHLLILEDPTQTQPPNRHLPPSDDPVGPYNLPQLWALPPQLLQPR